MKTITTSISFFSVVKRKHFLNHFFTYILIYNRESFQITSKKHYLP